jgi:hypothetical protein
LVLCVSDMWQYAYFRAILNVRYVAIRTFPRNTQVSDMWQHAHFHTILNPICGNTHISAQYSSIARKCVYCHISDIEYCAEMCVLRGNVRIATYRIKYCVEMCVLRHIGNVREQLCNRYCSNTHTHVQTGHLTSFFHTTTNTHASTKNFSYHHTKRTPEPTIFDGRLLKRFFKPPWFETRGQQEPGE